MKHHGRGIHQSTLKSLAERRTASGAPMTLRRLATVLGYPDAYASTLSDVLRNRSGALSFEAENDLRRRLGLAPILPPVPAQPCPTCSAVHGDGYDCRGARIQIVRRRPHPVRIQDMTAAQIRYAITHRTTIDVTPV